MKPTFRVIIVSLNYIGATINIEHLSLSIGSSFHYTEPGWFRVCFANMDDLTTEIALRRIRTFVDQKKGGEVVPVKNKR